MLRGLPVTRGTTPEIPTRNGITRISFLDRRVERRSKVIPKAACLLYRSIQFLLLEKTIFNFNIEVEKIANNPPKSELFKLEQLGFGLGSGVNSAEQAFGSQPQEPIAGNSHLHNH